MTCARDCLNGGICDGTFQGRWMCNCKTGFTGDACQLVSWDHLESPLLFTKEINARNDELEAQNNFLAGFCILMGFGFIIMVCVSIFAYRRYQAAAVSYHHQENAIVRNFSRSTMPEGVDPESLLDSTKIDCSD